MLLDRTVRPRRPLLGGRLRLDLLPRHAEAALVVGLTLVAFGLRVWQLSTAGLDHFDEGVYVFSALGLTDPSQPLRLYPEQIKFSPPVFLALVGLSYLLSSGPSDTAALMVNVVLGALTVPAVWWVGRTWFGAPAGIAAAALIAFNEFHIGLSRSALTDVPFALFLLVSLAAISSAIRHRSFRLAVVAGLATGLAWNTKYHGWFAIVVAGLALVPYLWCRRSLGFTMRGSVVVWAAVAVVAALSALPWALFIQSEPGGYAGLLHYQHTLFSNNWAQSLLSQIQNQQFLDGPLSRGALLAGLVCALLVAPRPIKSTPRFTALLVLLCASVILVGSFATLAALALVAVPRLLRDRKTYPSWLLLSWLGVWVVMTPFYSPYARLVLPFTIAASLAAGVSLAAAASSLGHDWLPRSAKRPLLAALGVLLVTGSALVQPHTSDPWRPVRSVAEAALAIEEIVPTGSRVIVVGEPELAFYLHLAGRPAFERIETPADLRAVGSPAYVVAGVYARVAPALRDSLASFGDRLVPLASYVMDPKDIRLLDDLRAQGAEAYRTAPDDTFRLILYRLDPAPASADTPESNEVPA